MKILSKLLPKFFGLYLNMQSVVSKRKSAKKAFDLFATVRKGKVAPHQKQYLDSTKKDMLKIEGHDIQTYHWPGKGETVVLVHGWESNTFRWRNLIAKLRAANFNIIAFDGPGHGYSSGHQLHVPLYAEVLQHIIQFYTPTHLVGHSIGGMTVLYNDYLNSKTTVEKIVTVAAPSDFEEIMDNYQQMLGFNFRTRAALEDYIFARFGFHFADFSTSKIIGNSTKKGLLFHDKWDKITPYHASQKVHKNWKDSRFITTEGLGHSMHQDDINDEIVNFLGE